MLLSGESKEETGEGIKTCKLPSHHSIGMDGGHRLGGWLVVRSIDRRPCPRKRERRELNNVKFSLNLLTLHLDNIDFIEKEITMEL